MIMVYKFIKGSLKAFTPCDEMREAECIFKLLTDRPDLQLYDRIYIVDDKGTTTKDWSRNEQPKPQAATIVSI